MKLTVILRNETPIHSGDPEKARISLEGNLEPSGSKEGFPLTRTRTMSVVSDADIDTDPDTYTGEVCIRKVPIVPGNSMRNLLRRSALNIVFNALRGRESMDIAAYVAASSGNSSGTPEGQASSFDETVALRAHPFLGLFGGGPRMLRGRLSVDNLYPMVKSAAGVIDSVFHSMLMDLSVSPKSPKSIIQRVWIRRVDPVASSPAENAELVTGGSAALTQWCVDALNTKNASKRKKGADADESEEPEGERGINAFNAHEVCVPGLTWAWNLRLDRVNDVQLALVLKAVFDIAGNQMQIGGGNAKDYGKVDILDVCLDGSSIWSGDGYADSQMPLFDKLAEALDELTVQQFNDFVKSSKEKV